MLLASRKITGPGYEAIEGATRTFYSFLGVYAYEFRLNEPLTNVIIQKTTQRPVVQKTAQ